MFLNCPPKLPRDLILETEAIQRITELLISLASEENADEENSLAYFLVKRQKLVEFYVTKIVKDILAYCNREDFPEPLIYTVVELILKRFADELAKNAVGTDAPISKVKMGDTEYSFDTSLQVAVSKVDLGKIISEELFNTLKTKLNLYRRVKSL